MQIDLRYPIGKLDDQKYTGNESFSPEIRDHLLNDIKKLPQLIEYAVQNMDHNELETPYRPGGWTIKQLVHHISDSHMNACIRFKLGLTENNPTIKPYDQDAWAVLNDTNTLPVNISLTLLHALHIKMYALLKDLKEEEWQRTVYHPEHETNLTLWRLLALYAWHGNHHLAHITNAREAVDM